MMLIGIILVYKVGKTIQGVLSKVWTHWYSGPGVVLDCIDS